MYEGIKEASKCINKYVVAVMYLNLLKILVIKSNTKISIKLKII